MDLNTTEVVLFNSFKLQLLELGRVEAAIAVGDAAAVVSLFCSILYNSLRHS